MSDDVERGAERPRREQQARRIAGDPQDLQDHHRRREQQRSDEGPQAAADGGDRREQDEQVDHVPENARGRARLRERRHEDQEHHRREQVEAALAENARDPGTGVREGHGSGTWTEGRVRRATPARSG